MLADLAGEGLGGGPVELARLRPRQRRHHVQALAAGGLAEADQAQGLQPVAHLPRRLDHRIEADVRRRIEVEHQPARRLRIAGLAVPGVIFDAAALGGRDEGLGGVELKVRLAVARHGGEGDQRRGAGPRVPLEEPLVAFDAVRGAHQGTRPALEVDQHPFGDLFEIAGELDLGDRGDVAGGGPQDLGGIGDGDAQHHRAAFGRRRRPGRLGRLRIVGHCRRRRTVLGDDLPRGLVLPESLEAGLADVAVAGPAGELDLGDQLGLHPVHPRGLRRRARSLER